MLDAAKFSGAVKMADASYYREKAEQCRRLARESTDGVLVDSLTKMAAEYTAHANAIETTALGEDPTDAA
jgi:hypothetical protein